MKLKTTLSIIGAAVALTLSAAANADRDWGRDRHWDHRGHHHQHRHWDRHDRRHYSRHYVPHRVVRERVIIERPVYVAPPAPVYYGHYPRARYPGIVVNVDIPPLVIPLR